MHDNAALQKNTPELLTAGGKQSDKPDPKQLLTDADEENAWEALQRMKNICAFR